MTDGERTAAVTDEERTVDASSTDGNDPTDPRIDRRQLLRTTVNLGVSTGLVWGFGAAYVSRDDVNSITYALARPEPGADVLEPRTREVPVPWHESLQLAFRAQETIRQAGISSVVDSFVVPGSYDQPDASLSVGATDESVSETLEELVMDVDVEVSTVGKIPPQPEDDQSVSEAHQIADPDAERIPGGVVCEANGMYGTLAAPLFDAESQSRYFTTSNHVYGASGAKETEHRGRPLSLVHGDETRRIGTVERGYPEVDVVQVTPTGEYRPVPEIDRATPGHVIGQYTKVGLADLVAREEGLTKLGAVSDRTTGPIKGVDGVTCYTGQVCKRGQLKWGTEESLKDGDSGSVNFHEDPENPEEYVLVGGINNARTWWPTADFTWGTAGYHLLEEYGLHF